MPVDEYSAEALLTVAGSPLPDDLKGALLSVSVDTRRGAPAMFVVRFQERAEALSDAKITVGAAVQISLQLSGPGGPVPMLSGTVTTIETEFGPNGATSTVRGMDEAYRLVGARRYSTYVNMTASDIAQEVARRAGLAAKVDATTVVLPYVVQPNLTDWDFLQRLALESGSALFVENGALVFGSPADSSRGPSEAADARTNALVLEYGVNIVALRATVTGTSQVAEVEARGWDPNAKRAVVATVPTRTRSATLASETPLRLGSQGKAPSLVISSAAHSETSQVQAFAASVADRVAGSFAEFEATVIGSPDLRVGAAIALAGCGSPFDGRYAVSAARHEIGESGYLTTVTVSDAADRSLYGITHGLGVGSARTSGPEIVPAIVTDINDPDRLGRVRVKLPTAGDDVQTWWARVVQIGAGGKRGLVLPPEVNDEVLVVLTEGGLGQPYVIGGLFNGVDVPRDGWTKQIVSGEVVRRSLTSRTGMFVEFVEETGTESIAVSSADGKQCLTIVTKPEAAVKVTSSGPIDLTAGQDVTVKANGNVTVQGAKVSLTGTSEISLSAPVIKVAAEGPLGLQGTTVDVKGDAQAVLSSSGITLVKGSMVHIN